MANKEIIYRRIKKLREYISKLKALQKHSFEKFDINVEINWAIDRGLQLAIESCIDIGKEIITASDFEKPESYQHIFQILRKHQIIDENLCEKIQELTRFRNKLIHDYLYLDSKEIYMFFKKNLGYFEEYLYAIEKFMKKV
ncbi:DUF86 domain-containing protein [Patescibacteria group bacterium]|nr:DUF86 domain-containing protein [Patescibacteria group bacterium]